MRRICSLVTLLLFSSIALNGIAAPVAISGLSGSYTPGGTVSFEVSLPPITNLGSYNIDLLLTGTSGVAGTDFFFDLAATNAASSAYVFASTTNYFDAVNVDSPLVHRLTLSDFDFTGVDVTAAVNDRVATVAIGTTGGFQGDLSLAIDTAGLILDTPDNTPTPVQGFSQIVADTSAAGDFDIVVVPEPSALAIIFVTLGTLCLFRKTPYPAAATSAH